MQGMTLVLNKTLGANVVTIYNVSRTLTRVPMQCVLLMNGAIYTEFSGLVAGGALNKAREIHRLIHATAFTATYTAAMLADQYGRPDNY